MKPKIKGGYYIKARCIQNSEIAIMPPYIREIWDWLLKEANHTDKKINGTVIKRGQLIRTFKDIQEGLKWMVGWRKMTYKKWQCENAMKFLRKRGMITTRKTTRGMLITICKYDYYQNPENYENNRKADKRTTDYKQTTDTINKNDNNDNNDKNNNISPALTIFNYWKEKLHHKQAKPTKDRLRKIDARLKEGYTIEDCKRAIDGCANSEFHQGKNKDKKKYDSIGLIFRNGEKLEEFMNYLKKDQAVDNDLPLLTDHLKKRRLKNEVI